MVLVLVCWWWCWWCGVVGGVGGVGGAGADAVAIDASDASDAGSAVEIFQHTLLLKCVSACLPPRVLPLAGLLPDQANS